MLQFPVHLQLFVFAFHASSFMLLNVINVMHCTYFHNLFHCFELKSWVSIPSFFSLCNVNVRSRNAANSPVHQGQLRLVSWGNILFVFCFMYKDQHIPSEKTGITVGTRFHFFFQSLQRVPFGLVMISFNCFKKMSRGRWDGSLGSGIYHQAWPPDLDPWNLHGGKRVGTHSQLSPIPSPTTHTQSSETMWIQMFKKIYKIVNLLKALRW